jgi:hypothetical protein
VVVVSFIVTPQVWKLQVVGTALSISARSGPGHP